MIFLASSSPLIYPPWCTTECTLMLKTRSVCKLSFTKKNSLFLFLTPSLCLSCTLASCEIVLTKHNNIHQPLQIGYQDLMALKYKQYNMYMRVKRVVWLSSSCLVSVGMLSGLLFSPSPTANLNLFTVCLSARMENPTVVVYRQSDSLICNRKENTIIFITCRLDTCSYILFVLPLSFFFQALSLRAAQVFRLTGGIPIDPSIWQSSVCEA